MLQSHQVISRSFGHFQTEAMIKSAGFEADESCLHRRFGDSHALALVKFTVGSAVYRQIQHFLTLTNVADFQYRMVGEDHRASNERMRADRGHAKALYPWVCHRATCRHGISRRAGGGGYNDTVRAECGDCRTAPLVSSNSTFSMERCSMV